MTPLKILLIGILIYLAWAFIFHKRDKSLTWPIFLEYVLTAVLVLILLLGVLV
ncbi:hypothetical protein HYZ05_03240 [Candidatus Daviesbacteria bacterium]|nr:hypothetical protein [Candidatus Daviesbacteria bacterium]